MKLILLISASILSFTFVVNSQNINELEQNKSILLNILSSIQVLKNKTKIEADSILASKESNLNSIKLNLASINISKDSLRQIIVTYNISGDNLKIYDLLKTEKIIDPSTNKFGSLYKRLRKEYSLDKETEFIIIENNIYLEKRDGNGRVFSIEKVKLSIDQIDKQNKLLAKGAIRYLLEANLLLEGLTGVNTNYLTLIEKLETLDKRSENATLSIIDLENVKNQISQEYHETIARLDQDCRLLMKSITDIDNQLISISEKKKYEQQKTINYSKYKTKKINGIEIYASPLSVKEFRNGYEIKKARTEGEWKKFIELKIPAYHFKNFEDHQSGYGLIYNYYAITDSSELAPVGFHKLNLMDLNYLDGQLVFSETQRVDCYCGDGKETNYESCPNCNYWTRDQKKYNVCSKCQNRGFINVGIKECSRCHGTRKISILSISDRKFCVFPNSQYIHQNDTDKNIDKCLLNTMEIYDGKCRFAYDQTQNNFQEKEYQLLICKDRSPKYTDDKVATTIGDVQIMNTFLDVTKFRNGDEIKYIEDPVEWELALKNKIPAFCYYNNIKDGKGCIYNIYAWQDKRGLIPQGWRSITSYDLINMSISLNYSFSLTSAYSPVKPPLGARNTDGSFIDRQQIKAYNSHWSSNNYNAQLNFEIHDDYSISSCNSHLQYCKNDCKSGYVLCVRESEDQKIEKKINDSIRTTDFLEQNSELLRNDMEYFKTFEKSGDYQDLYNDSGVKIIDDIVKSDFEQLFDKNGEIRVICLENVEIYCKDQYCCGYSEYIYDEHNNSDNIAGLIIKRQSDGANSFVATAIIANTNRYQGGFTIIESTPLIRKDELVFSLENYEMTFCFSRNKCKASNNPLTNFYVVFNYYNDNLIGIDTKWYSLVEGDYWDFGTDKALDKVLDFMNKN